MNIQEFLDKNLKFYDQETQKFILERIYESQVLSPILLQILATTNSLADKDNIYLKISELITSIYGSNKDILEVGCGHYPAFAKIVDEKHLANTITCCDPSLIHADFGNIKTYTKIFDSSFDVSSYSLIVGIKPCAATKVIIESANNNEKEFFVSFCGCFAKTIGLEYLELTSKHRFYNFIYQIIKESLPKNFEITMIDSPIIYDENPIIFTKRRSN